MSETPSPKTELPAQEAAIRARLAAATPGPWHHVVGQWNALYCIADCGAWAKDCRQHCVERPRENVNISRNAAADDAEFIAHAPDDISFLLSAFEKVRVQLTALDTDYGNLVNQYNAECGELRSALSSQREELERLTKENEQMRDELVKVEDALVAVHRRHDIDAMACDTFAEEIALLGDVIQSRDEQLVLAWEAIIAKDAEIGEQRDELSSYAEEHEMLRLILGCPDETPTLEQARIVMSTLDSLRGQLASPENSNV